MRTSPLLIYQAQRNASCVCKTLRALAVFPSQTENSPQRKL